MLGSASKVRNYLVVSENRNKGKAVSYRNIPIYINAVARVLDNSPVIVM